MEGSAGRVFLETPWKPSTDLLSLQGTRLEAAQKRWLCRDWATDHRVAMIAVARDLYSNIGGVF
jgi:hypothetical protein